MFQGTPGNDGERGQAGEPGEKVNGKWTIIFKQDKCIKIVFSWYFEWGTDIILMIHLFNQKLKVNWIPSN